jgi:hypothetical protein
MGVSWMPPSGSAPHELNVDQTLPRNIKRSKVGSGFAKGAPPNHDSYIPATFTYAVSCTKGRDSGLSIRYQTPDYSRM